MPSRGCPSTFFCPSPPSSERLILLQIVMRSSIPFQRAILLKILVKSKKVPGCMLYFSKCISYVSMRLVRKNILTYTRMFMCLPIPTHTCYRSGLTVSVIMLDTQIPVPFLCLPAIILPDVQNCFAMWGSAPSPPSWHGPNLNKSLLMSCGNVSLDV